MAKRNKGRRQGGQRPVTALAPRARGSAQPVPAIAAPRSLAAGAVAEPAPVGAREQSRTREQDRARYALACVNRRKDSPQAKDYAIQVRSLGTMVLQDGLGQALAYLLSKSQESLAHRALYDDLQDWLTGPAKDGQGERVYHATTDLIDALMTGSRREYQLAQRSSLLLLTWMKKFADAYLPKGERS